MRFLVSFLLFFILTSRDVLAANNSSKGSKITSSTIGGKAQKSVLGACTRCRLLANSVIDIFKKYDGQPTGSKTIIDAEGFKRLRKEISIAKVWDSLCYNIKAGQNDCRSLAEDNFKSIQAWYASPEVDATVPNPIFHSLCISGLSTCCPDGHYGPKCSTCSGHPDSICSGNGKCAGAGTRLGNGHCLCRKGFTGEACERCEKGYYLEDRKCVPCDTSCDSTCMRGGPLGCHVCRKGYEWIDEAGCLDIDECDETKPTPCKANSFCINTEGSHQCYECDPACDGCHGDGPDSCLKCAPEHDLKDGSCVNPNPPTIPMPPPPAFWQRYLTYAGMVFVAGVISRHNLGLAAVIGLFVAVYIAFAERNLETEQGKKFDDWLKRMGWVY